MKNYLVILIQEMPKFAIAFLTIMCLALPFNANADFWKDLRDFVKDTLETLPTGSAGSRVVDAVVEVPSFTICGSKWYQRLGLQLMEVEQATRGGYSFDVACQAHDACYGDCRTPRSDCDQKLLADAEGVCDSARNRQNCTADAQIFFQAVSEKGEMPFRQARANCSGTAQQSYEDAGFKAAVFVRNHGNDFSGASPIVVGTVEQASIDGKGDKDYFRFTPSYRAVYVIYSTGDTDTSGELYDAEFNLKKSEWGGGEKGNFRIAYRMEKGQTYYVMVRGKSGRYALHIDGPESGTVSDDHGFSSYSATLVKAGSRTEGRIDVENDQDYFKFIPGHQATYVIYTTGEARTSGGELYDADFNLKKSAWGDGENGNFRIAYRMEKGQTYYVMVRGKLGRYNLHIDGPEGGTVSDDHGFSIYSATLVKVGNHTEGRIDVRNDQDYFKFIPGHQATYIIYTTGIARTSGGELYDADFNLKKSAWGDGENGNFRIAYRMEKGQAYYVMVRGEPGRYNLHIAGPEGESVKGPSELHVDGAGKNSVAEGCNANFPADSAAYLRRSIYVPNRASIFTLGNGEKHAAGHRVHRRGALSCSTWTPRFANMPSRTIPPISTPA